MAKSDTLLSQEGVTSHTENMQYLNLALKAFAQKHRGLSSSWMTQHPKDSHPVKRDCTGQVLRHDLSVPLTVPFGPHLTPVHCQQGHSPQPDTRGMTIEEPEVDSCRKCSVRSQQSCAAENSETRQKTDRSSLGNTPGRGRMWVCSELFWSL